MVVEWQHATDSADHCGLFVELVEDGRSVAAVNICLIICFGRSLVVAADVLVLQCQLVIGKITLRKSDEKIIDPQNIRFEFSRSICGAG